MNTSHLAPYWSPEARTAKLRALADRAGAEVVQYGESRDGEPLHAARLPGPRAGPRVLCTANLHGPEFIGGRIAMSLLEAAATADAAFEALRARAELWVIPCLNPDGYRKTWDAVGRGPLATLRTNAAGVDLNRNFPLPSGAPTRWIPGAGSTRPGAATYRGPTPLSEPETAALHQLLTAYPMHGSANLHSFMGTLIPARVRDVASFQAYRRLCAVVRRHQAVTRYHRLSSRWLDVFTGELEDHQHHALGTWALCIEAFSIAASLRQSLHAASTFWRFNPIDPAPWIANDRPAILAYLGATLDYARPDHGLAPRAVSRTDS